MAAVPLLAVRLGAVPWAAALLAAAAPAATALAEPRSQLKQALQLARCIPRAVAVTLREGAMTVYDVACLGPSPDRVVVVCTGRVCLPDDPDHHDGPDETP
ncbi:hypothetical protein M446_3473 [Methylobacterium sp. 4-46]|nr:hypothetical protein M446_3473 [Methylobacterium sp. 4-46]